MAWEVEYTRLFQVWWDSLSEDEQVEISAKIELLQEFGPVLPRPHADVITTSRHANMKELRGKVRIDICGCCMRSTRGAQPYCSSRRGSGPVNWPRYTVPGWRSTNCARLAR